MLVKDSDKERYMINEVEVILHTANTGSVNGKAVVGKSRIDLLDKIGGILQDEYECPTSYVWGFYNVVDLKRK